MQSHIICRVSSLQWLRTLLQCWFAVFRSKVQGRWQQLRVYICTTIIHQVLTKNISKIQFLFTFPQNTLQVTSSLCSLLYSPAGITIHRFAYLCTFSSTAMTRKCPNLGQKMGDSRHINQENEIHITELSQSTEFLSFSSDLFNLLPLQEHQLISPRLYHGRTKREVCQNLP